MAIFNSFLYVFQGKPCWVRLPPWVGAPEQKPWRSEVQDDFLSSEECEMLKKQVARFRGVVGYVFQGMGPPSVD